MIANIFNTNNEKHVFTTIASFFCFSSLFQKKVPFGKDRTKRNQTKGGIKNTKVAPYI